MLYPSDFIAPGYLALETMFPILPASINIVTNQRHGSKKDGSRTKPSDCPSGTLPISEAKKRFGLDHETVEALKDGVGADAPTWTGVAPNGDIWVGTRDGKGRKEGNISDYEY